MGGATKKEDVWTSTNGIDWLPVTNAAPWSEREDHASVVYGDKIYVVGGEKEHIDRNDIWSSPDGETWTLATEDVPWAGRQGHSSVVHHDSFWILGGFDSTLSLSGGARRDVWRYVPKSCSR